MPTYDAITVFQPWALLIASGLKEFETRSWKPPAHLIGRHLYIHAGQQFGTEEAFYTADFMLRFPETKLHLNTFPVRGAILPSAN